MVEEDYTAGAGELFEQLYALGVVLVLDLFVIREGCVLGRVVEELEPVLVEGGIGLSMEVLDFDDVGHVFLVGGTWVGMGRQLQANIQIWTCCRRCYRPTRVS